MRGVFKLIGSVAVTRTNVLIQGESGTGKELVAKAIHYNSPLPGRAVHRHQLLGHPGHPARDRSSSATSRAPSPTPSAETKGKFEIAGKGTLFLDEVGDVSPNLQSKLLRVIETRDFMKVGGEKVLKTEARIIAATNQNLKALIEKGRFREDLYYRLKVVEIRLPALRERREDIPDLVAYLLEKINRELRRNVRKVPPEVMKVLADIALARQRPRARERPDPGRHPGQGGRPAQGEPAPRARRAAGLLGRARAPRRGREEVHPARPQRRPGSKTRASQILQISRPTLDKKIKEYGLELGETS
ncbi:MAG: sigma 54-interacting transcriptional regulator [Ignavibacteriales bacterium]|nr:sigma 54-interacting transcriptional regulator [Ignavibacteriales bacterium]